MIPTRRVVNAILKEARQRGLTVDHLKLQKLLFLTASRYAVATGDSLIPEQFGVWEYGPVVDSLYHEFKRFGAQPIDSFALEFDPDTREEVAVIPSSSETPFWEALRATLDDFGHWTGVQLSTYTHRPDGPWAAAKAAGESFIPHERIVACFRSQDDA